MTATRLDSILQRDRNSFDVVRLLAAMSVVFGHAFALHPSGGMYEPVSWFFDFTYSGAVAVDVFFFLSGILITSSFCQSRSIVRFIAMRLARIWPGLALCLIVTVVLVGTLVTAHPASSYFETGDTSRVRQFNHPCHHNLQWNQRFSPQKIKLCNGAICAFSPFFTYKFL